VQNYAWYKEVKKYKTFSVEDLAGMRSLGKCRIRLGIEGNIKQRETRKSCVGFIWLSVWSSEHDIES
jgi:hypothetical protein